MAGDHLARRTGGQVGTDQIGNTRDGPITGSSCRIEGGAVVVESLVGKGRGAQVSRVGNRRTKG